MPKATWRYKIPETLIKNQKGKSREIFRGMQWIGQYTENAASNWYEPILEQYLADFIMQLPACSSCQGNRQIHVKSPTMSQFFKYENFFSLVND